MVDKNTKKSTMRNILEFFAIPIGLIVFWSIFGIIFLATYILSSLLSYVFFLSESTFFSIVLIALLNLAIFYINFILINPYRHRLLDKSQEKPA